LTAVGFFLLKAGIECWLFSETGEKIVVSLPLPQDVESVRYTWVYGTFKNEAAADKMAIRFSPGKQMALS